MQSATENKPLVFPQDRAYSRREQDPKSNIKVNLQINRFCAQSSTECLNVSNLPNEHQNIGQTSSDIPTPTTPHQLFEQNLLRKDMMKILGGAQGDIWAWLQLWA
ncbi:Uncharacterized protein Fot_33094 [Forsythia ovata]|uniref:Uncharacterized protein n=1 Tax=Forsythia ovata TaxID=205694 RepID=A0ABD1T9P9_9LAMI